ncbi:MAG: GNAT family N-acetyltransferase [Candidatus Kariarchaeaceae archaeon]
MIRIIEREDLKKIADWPPYLEQYFSWANFPAKTDHLRDRWYKTQIKDHLIWFVIQNSEYQAENNDIISRCSFTQPLEGEEYLFGIVIRSDLVNQGIGSTCTKIALSFVFQITSVESIWLETKFDNYRARKVWENIGFTYLGNHYRREVFGRYQRYAGYRIFRQQIDDLVNVID